MKKKGNHSINRQGQSMTNIAFNAVWYWFINVIIWAPNALLLSASSPCSPVRWYREFDQCQSLSAVFLITLPLFSLLRKFPVSNTSKPSNPYVSVALLCLGWLNHKCHTILVLRQTMLIKINITVTIVNYTGRHYPKFYAFQMFYVQDCNWCIIVSCDSRPEIADGPNRIQCQ